MLRALERAGLWVKKADNKRELFVFSRIVICLLEQGRKGWRLPGDLIDSARHKGLRGCSYNYMLC